jgi:hypothetical protein
MGLIGHEIIQSRVWVDPTNPPPPSLNYKYTFPVTVFDAVRRDMMDDNSETLTQVIDTISQEIKGKQDIIPAKPANYLMTYAGVAGAVGSIKISKEIPWDEENQSNNRIPTEKAVGDLIRKLGVDPNNPESGARIIWTNIIGRPTIYNSLGNDDNGVITQKAITEHFAIIEDKVNNNTTNISDNTNNLDILKLMLSDHISNNNAHSITIDQIGAISTEAFEHHITSENPHNITPDMIGLGNVNNTSDINKPISLATQEALDLINSLITKLDGDIEELNFVTDIKYNFDSSTLDLVYRNGTIISIYIPMGKSITSIEYDSDNKKLISINNDGTENKIDISELFIRYLGSVDSIISIVIEGDQVTGNQIIKASINPKSITDYQIADDAIITRTIKDQAITDDKIKDYTITNTKYANRSISGEKVEKYTLKNDNFADRSVDGRTLFSSENDDHVLATIKAGSDPIWVKVTGNMIADDSINTNNIADKSITNEKIAINAIGTHNINDYSITSEKIANNSITSDKIADDSITSETLAPDLTFKGNPKLINTPDINSNSDEIVNSKWVRSFIKDELIVEESNIAKRAVTGRQLFSSPVKNKILAVLKADQDPEWTTINNGMMGIDSVSTNNIIDNSIIGNKIADNSIESRHLSIHTIQPKHISESAITSKKIYTSHEANRVLAALSEDGHPTYSQVTNPMIAPNAIGTNQIMDNSITLSKIQSSNDGQKVMTVGLSGSIPVWSKVMPEMIADRAIDGSKLFTSEYDNVILSITRADTNPAWTKVTGNMIADNTIISKNMADHSIDSRHLSPQAVDSDAIKENAIQSKHIEVGAIKPELIETYHLPGRILAVTGEPYSAPMWSQVNSLMVEDEAITKEKLFRSNYPYRVLGTTQPHVPPEYIMITHHFIVDGTIIPQKLQRDFTLLGTPELTVQPPSDANDMRLANTKWVRETIIQMSKYILKGYLGNSSQFTIEPLSSDDINNSINFIYADNTPSIPDETSNVYDIKFNNNSVITQIPNRDIRIMNDNAFSENPPSIPDSTDFDTISNSKYQIHSITNASVGDKVDNAFSENPSDIPDYDSSSNNTNTGNNTSTPSWWPTYNFNMNDIPDHSIDGSKLFTHTRAPRVLGITSPNDNVEFILIEESLIANGAVTTDKIQRSIHLLGSPSIEIRPTPDASEANGTGTLIPDCQWVLDRIIDGINGVSLNGSGATAGINLSIGSVTSEHIQNRSIIGDKIFTSAHANRLLGVSEANSSPKYLQAVNEMIADKAIDGRTLFSSSIPEKVLAVHDADSDPEWTQITPNMVSDNAIEQRHIADKSVGENQIDNNAITARTLSNEPLINETQLMDNTVSEYKIKNNAVTTSKLEDESVTNDKIKDNSITGDKLISDIILPEDTSIQSSSNYEQRIIRNIIISPNIPKGGHNGDIWFKFA